MSKVKGKVRINVGADKETPKTRSNRAKGIGATAPSSPIYQSQPEVKSACDTVVTLGAEIVAREEAVQAAELLLIKERSARDAKVVEYDAAYDVCTSLIEKHAKKPEDVQGLGLGVLDRASYGMAPPIGVRARFDAAKNVISIRVELAPGMRTCVTEISATASEPRTWKRLPGVGSRPTLSGYAPGTYWIRAASTRANEESEFTTPVAVIVR
ncbi:MAG: hypothetical protein QM820_14900 [Minicystis sp.]